MSFKMNRTRGIAPVHPDDSVRITTDDPGGAVESVVLDLSRRVSDLHCLVALPLLPNDFADEPGRMAITLRTRYVDDANARMSFTLWVASYQRGHSIAESRLKFFAGPEEARVSLDLPIPREADRYQLIVYADRHYRGVLTLDDIRVAAGFEQYVIGPSTHIRQPVEPHRRWRQDGTRLWCSSMYGDYWAEMPAGWQLDAIPPGTLAAADWLLFAELDRQMSGVATPPPQPSTSPAQRSGRVLLHHPATLGSATALTLLDSDTIPFHVHRPFTRYFMASGAVTELPDPKPWFDRVQRSPNVIIVPTTFELARVAAGRPIGFAHGYGALAIGILLAPHVAAGVIASGALLEAAFLGSGHLFADVVALPSSSYNTLRRVMMGAGLDFALPVAGCSEVVAWRVVNRAGTAGLAMWCSQPLADGSDCGRCFSCFRIRRLAGDRSAAEPSDSVLRVLDQHPLKIATSVVYAAQRSGFAHPALDEFRDVDLRFLERHFAYGVEHMVPPADRDHIRDSLSRLGVEPMSEDDELRLRLIGQTFAPESFSLARAGIQETAGVA